MSSLTGKLPNLVIAGVHKAGTTSLYSYLGKHPEICPSHTKEIGFFGPLVFGREPASLDSYAKYFDHCEAETYRLEASPSYLYGKGKVAQALKDNLPDARVLIVLRDPADRLRSFFSRAVSKSTLPEDMSFADYLAISKEQQESSEHTVYSRGLREGRYIDYLEPWQKIFGDKLKIVFFDELKADAQGLTRAIIQWLDLDPAAYATQNFTVENETVHYRKRRLHQHVRNLYIRSESFWRRHDGLKKWLRNGYNRFNVDKRNKAGVVDEEAMSWLREFYLPHNRKLKDFLQAQEYDRLPGWLS